MIERLNEWLLSQEDYSPETQRLIQRVCFHILFVFVMLAVGSAVLLIAGVTT